MPLGVCVAICAVFCGITHALAMTVTVGLWIGSTLVCQDRPALVVCCTVIALADWVVIMARFEDGNATEGWCTSRGRVNTGVHVVPWFTVCTIWPCEVMAQPAPWSRIVRCSRTGSGVGVAENIVARLIPLATIRAVQYANRTRITPHLKMPILKTRSQLQPFVAPLVPGI